MILKRHLQTVNMARAAVDMLAVVLSWALAFSLRFESGLLEMPKGTDTFSNYARLFPILIISYFMVLSGTGVYARSLAKRRVWDENFDLLRGHCLSFLVFVSVSFFLFEHRYSRIMMVLFFGIVPVLLALGRSLVRKMNRRYLSRASATLDAIVVGQGELHDRILSNLQTPNEWNLKVVATLKLEELDRLQERLVSGGADVVLFTGQIPKGVQGIENTLTEVILIPDLGVPSLLSPRLESFAGLPAIGLNSSPLDGYGQIQKRVFDIAFSSAFLLVFSPVYLACAIAVKLSSTGPVFYRQERTGLDGRSFWCLKFRGMRADAESESGPVWATKDDERVTSVGKWLRRTSLDEIPQFWNVLKGEMSVVGPRPERPVFVKDFRNSIPGYMLRHKVKAGITGWAQINGWRGNTSLEKRIECDLWYLQNWSVWLDLKISFLTPFKGFVHPNAY